MVEVLEASPGRRTPPCPHGRAGCGGCGWQHVEPDEQLALKRELVADALRRQGGRSDLPVRLGPTLAVDGFRTTVRLAVHGDRGAFRAGGSHRLVDVDDCGVAHPLLATLVGAGRFHGAREVVLRAGAATGDRLAVLHPSGRATGLPPDVVVVRATEPGTASVREVVGGHEFRIGATSFFQTRPDGAAALVEVVGDALEGAAEGPLVDAYAGVGLFGAAPGRGPPGGGRGAAPLVGSRRPPQPGAAATPASCRPTSTRWTPEPAAVVVADPARAGLGRSGVEVLAATGASRLVLVSCDAARARSGREAPGGGRLQGRRGRGGRPVPAHPARRGGHPVRPCLTRAPTGVGEPGRPHPPTGTAP